MREALKYLLYIVGLIVAVLVVGYLDQDDASKPSWVRGLEAAWQDVRRQTTWSASIPDCVNPAAQDLALSLARKLLVPGVSAEHLPLHLAHILDRGVDDSDAQHCWAEVQYQSPTKPTALTIAAITYLISEDAADPARFVVRVTIQSRITDLP